MLLLYVPLITPRIQYIFKLIFERRLGVTYNINTNIEDFTKYTGEKLNYSSQRFNDEFFITAHKILDETGTRQIDIPVRELNGMQVLFNNLSDDLGFDIFSATFYMVSRYEEYLPFTPDNFGRFSSTHSLGYKNNFLKIPIVDMWIDIFKERLKTKYPHIQYSDPQFNCIITYDIDVAFKYKGRGIKRLTGASFKDIFTGKLKNLYYRFQTLSADKKDPWDTYGYLQKIITGNNFLSVFFFLVGDNSPNDRNLDYKHPLIKNLINTVKKFSVVGLHPSFTTTKDAKKILKEKQRLEAVSKIPVTKSRQHYLKILLPETYNALIESGISEDYSMAFPDMAGFRAGTCHPFNFYDLQNEKETNLLIYPCTFMDGNYIYSAKNKEDVVAEINSLIDEVMKVNGTFISIWHNHTVSETSDYNEWRKIHDAMIEKLKSAKNT